MYGSRKIESEKYEHNEISRFVSSGRLARPRGQFPEDCDCIRIVMGHDRDRQFLPLRQMAERGKMETESHRRHHSLYNLWTNRVRATLVKRPSVIELTVRNWAVASSSAHSTGFTTPCRES